MTATNRAFRFSRAVAFACAASALAGCSPGDVQLNGKLFDVMGLNSNEAPKEAKMAERAPLVLPPNAQRLPSPGSGPTATTALAEIKDPDANSKASQAELERQQAEFCKKNYEEPKSRGDQTVEGVKGPLGLCRGSLFTGLSNYMKGDAEEEGQQ